MKYFPLYYLKIRLALLQYHLPRETLTSTINLFKTAVCLPNFSQI